MKLASIEKIVGISPIEGADRIVCAKVLGYNCVIKKEEFNVGDLVVFHSPDTVVNKDDAHYAFLEKNHWRIKVAKLRGVYSYGLVLSLKDLFEIAGKTWEVVEGEDVTEIVKISKYEKPIPVGNAEIKGNFPSFIPKTDSERLKGNPKCFIELTNDLVVGTIKYDGSSSTFYWNNGEFGICSRNLRVSDENGKLALIARKYNLKEKLAGLNRNIAIQGEYCGPGVQGNPMGSKENDIFVFDIFDINNHQYLNYADFILLVRDLQLVPAKMIYHEIFNWPDIDFIQTWVNNVTYDNGKLAEGVVFKPVKETISSVLEGRLQVKVISEPYELKNG